MPTISSPGIGSGLDVTSIVNQLDAANRAPVKLLTTRTTALQAKLSAFGLLKSYTTNIHDTTAKLADPAFWQKTSASSSDSASVSVASSTSAAVGSYSVEVQQLAQAQSLSSSAYADSTSAVGTGSLRIELGSWNADKTAFTPATPPSQVDIPVPIGEDSLESVRAKINASNAGVSASIVKDSSGSRLVIRSNTTGAEHSVRITATADAPAAPGGPTLDDLVYNPPSGAVKVTETALAKNAKATLNGVAIESASNTLTEVTGGLSLTVSKVTTSAATVTVGLDTATMKSAIGDFVKAYNDLNRYVADQTKYDPDKKVAAALQGDRSTLSLQSQMRAAVLGNTGASTQFSRLSDMGIQIQPDGSLLVNDSKLSAAMSSNMPDVTKAFSKTDVVNPANNGFAVSLLKLTTALNNTDGLVTTHSQGLQANIDRNNKQVDVYNGRADDMKVRLLAQYSALDVKLNSLTALNSYVAQQITTWNKSA